MERLCDSPHARREINIPVKRAGRYSWAEQIQAWSTRVHIVWRNNQYRNAARTTEEGRVRTQAISNERTVFRCRPE